MTIELDNQGHSPWISIVFQHSGKGLAVAGDSAAAGARLVQATPDGRPSRQWRLEYVKGAKAYRIRARHSGKVLESDGSASAKIYQAKARDDLKQLWTINTAEGGGGKIRSIISGEALGVSPDTGSESLREGLDVRLWESEDSPARHLELVPAAAVGPFVPEQGAWYTLTFAHSAKVLDGYAWATSNGGAIVQYENRLNANQQWRFEEVEPGWYVVESRWSGLVLEVEDGSTSAGAKIHQWRRRSRESQHWAIEADGDTYRLIARHSGLALAARGGSHDNRVEVVQRPTGSAQAQRLHIRKVADPQPLTTANVLAHSPSSGSHRLPPLRLSGAGSTTIELWVRPNGNRSTQALFAVSNGGDAELILRRQEKDVRVVLRHGDTTQTLCRAQDALLRRRWNHVAVSIVQSKGQSALPGVKKYKVRLLIDGVVVDTSAGETSDPLFAKLHGLLRRSMVTACTLGALHDGTLAFAGRLAELRLWRRARSAEEIAEFLDRRLRGDESDLAACYRLDTLDDGRLLDIGPEAAHAVAATAAQLVPSTSLPAPATAGPDVGRVIVRDRLMNTWLPSASFSAADLRELFDEEGKSASDLGPTEHGRVNTPVYELFLRPVDGAGADTGREVIVYLEETQIAVVPDMAGAPRLERWSRGYHRIPTRGLEGARLSFVARGLATSRVFARHADMPARVWRAMAPDQGNAEKMLRVKGEELRTHGVLSTTQDVDLVLEVVQTLARVGLRPTAMREWDTTQPSGGTGGGFSIGKLFEKIEDAVEDTIDGAAEAAESAVEEIVEAAELVADGSLDLAQVLDRGALLVGEQAVKNCMATAKTLKVVTSSALELRNIVQIVGVRVIDGAEHYFRVIVRELSEAWAAIDGFFKRIGAGVRAFIAMLADALDWGKFLATSDQIYAEVVGVFDEAESLVAERLPAQGQSDAEWAENLEQQLGGFIDPLRAWPQDLAALQDEFSPGLPTFELKDIPGYDEMMWLLDKLQELMGSAKFKLPLPDINMPSLVPEWMDDVLESLPTLDLGNIAATDARPLIQALIDAWDEYAVDIVVGIYKLILEAAASVVSGVETALTARIEVPFLTELLEATVLGGRELSLLRVFSLIGAVPLRLWQIASGIASGSAQGPGGGNGGAEGLRIFIGIFPIINSLITAFRSLPGLDIGDGKEQAKVGTVHGILIAVQGIIETIVGAGSSNGLVIAGGVVNMIYGIETINVGAAAYLAREANLWEDDGMEAWVNSNLKTLDLLTGGAWFLMSAVEIIDRRDYGLDPWKESGYWASAHMLMGLSKVSRAKYGGSKDKRPYLTIATIKLSMCAFILNLGYMTDTIVDLASD